MHFQQRMFAGEPHLHGNAAGGNRALPPAADVNSTSLDAKKAKVSFDADKGSDYWMDDFVSLPGRRLELYNI